MGQKIKVSISATIEVDPETWDMNYGTGTQATAIKEDVKRYVHSLITESADGNMTVVKWS